MKKPYLALRRRIEDEGLEHLTLAAMAGMKKDTLSIRLNDKKPWKSDEITAICSVLHIPQDEIGKYFFPAVKKEDKAI